ncbi:MAG: hypothetical protein FJ206_05605 [Gemmatimonadetes bacterium]|nr:hypothetical protein [Gemmatimonadota bacterium]
MRIRRGWWVLAALLIGVSAQPALVQKGAQYIRVPDSSVVQVVKLTDGSTLVGRFQDVASEPLQFQTEGGVISIRRISIREVREVRRAAVRGGKIWHDDPNPTRLYFGPTARSLPKGQADFSNTYLFLLSGAAGVGSNIQIGGGFSVVPTDDFSENIFFLTAKAGIRPSPYVNLAVGGLLGQVGGFGSDLGGNDGEGVGAFYGVGTFGTEDHAFTAGAIFPYAAGDLGDDPVILAGAETRLARNIKFVTENYFTTGGGSDVEGIFSYGVRLFGEKMSVSLAFWNSTEDQIFPGLPYVDFVIRF